MIDIFFTIFICIWLIMMAVFAAIAIGVVIYEIIKTIKGDK